MTSRVIKKNKVGEVIGDKMKKTVIVEIVRRVKHPTFKKYYDKRSKFYAHDEKDTARLGDIVAIKEVAPISKLKRWKVVEVVKKAMIS